MVRSHLIIREMHLIADLADKYRLNKVSTLMVHSATYKPYRWVIFGCSRQVSSLNSMIHFDEEFNRSRSVPSFVEMVVKRLSIAYSDPCT